MKKIRTLLVDDEVGALRALQSIIEAEATEFEVVGTARSVEEAARGLKDLKPDLLFLDIQLQDRTGFELLMTGFDFEFEVVFVTAYDQYAIEAFKNNALSYLLKPISFDDFEQVKKRILKVMESDGPSQSTGKGILEVFKSKVALPQGSVIEYLDPNEIVFIQADGSYCQLYLTKGRKRLLSRPLKFIEGLIQSDHFFRPHRSYLVNAAFISSWDKSEGGTLLLEGDHFIPISKEGRKLLSTLI